MTKEEYLKMYELVGAAMEVYNELGFGMEEPIYQEAMTMELDTRGIPYVREKVLNTYYKGVQMKKTYVADYFRGKQSPNTGQLPQYLIENHHEGII